MILGLVLIIIGVVFLLQNLGYISESAWAIIWPAIMIIISLGVIFKRKDRGFFPARQNFYWPFWCPKDKEQSQEKQDGVKMKIEKFRRVKEERFGWGKKENKEKI